MHAKALRRALLGLLPYPVLLVAANALSSRLPGDSPLQIALVALPVIGCLAVLRAVTDTIRSLDEYQRKQSFEAIVFAFAATALTTFTWGFFEDAGMPKLPTFAIWPVMAGYWLLGGAWVSVRSR
ncbi:hypothetical protein [Celeribacter indicus]|uniref:Transmembrane protein n=1 Tax=Celeribacter indicus TaxID=1208324 RepID=A0A0B5DZZ3_9RHOB|nr:hypothetical protein [Celeribacter indicus]AJE46311.1 hypothetical protein P73_1596 [Celeribacter indicus]SDW53014.1 hypothetical protein SAMN05443573_104147 [Celeribacter indicus]